MKCKYCKGEDTIRRIETENGLYDLVCDKCHRIISKDNVKSKEVE